MFYNSCFVSHKVVGQLLRASYRLNNSCKGNFFSTIGRFRNNDTFIRIIKRGTVGIKYFNVKLTSTDSTCVCKSEENLGSSYPNDVKEQQKRESFFKEISNGNSEIEKKLKVIEFELEIYAEKKGNPLVITKKEDWETLLLKSSQHTRQRYYSYLWKRTRSSENDKLKKEKRRLKYLMRKAEAPTEDENEYRLYKNSMFMRIYDKTLSKMMNLHLMHALCFSQHIVFDCSYQPYMSHTNAKNCANQLAVAFGENRMHQAPFHVKLCNINKKDVTMKSLTKFIPGLFDETFLWDLHEESYLDLYPKERLVYLTPNARQELFEYNHEDVYIIGAYVDKGEGKKISLAKAKENNLRMAKLPIDYFLDWKQGTKSLAINHVLRIMLDMRLFNDWKVAFKNIPTRFSKRHQ